MTPLSVLTLAPFAGFGLALGALHFAALALNVRVLMRRQGFTPALGLPLLRLAVMSGGLCFAAMNGAGALLACFAGLLAARALALRMAEALS